MGAIFTIEFATEPCSAAESRGGDVLDSIDIALRRQNQLLPKCVDRVTEV